MQNKELKIRLELLGINFSKKLSEYDFQVINAPLLRKLAIEHLRNGTSDIANAFRAQIYSSESKTVDQYLRAQGRDGAWGKDIEAIALADLFGFNLDVVTGNSVMRRNNVGEYAPTIILTNFNNVHWSYNTKALGDGNCLYNAMLLAFYDLTKEEGTNFAPETSLSIINFIRNICKYIYNWMFGSRQISPEIAIEKQAEALAIYNRNALINRPLLNPMEIIKAQEESAVRSVSMPSDRVDEDHRIALQIACGVTR